MRHSTKIALSTLAIAIGSTLAHAQQPTEDDLNPQNRNPVGTQQGSQLDNDNSIQRGETTQQSDSAQRSGQQGDDNPAQLARQQNRDSSTQSTMTLEQLAMMQPEELVGKTLTDDDGEAIGEIEGIALKRDDQEAYAVINTKRNNKVALRLGELEIEALAYTQSADTLSQQQYQSSDYERFDQSRTDPRGDAGAQNSAGAAGGNAASNAAGNSAGNASSSTAGNAAGNNNTAENSPGSAASNSAGNNTAGNSPGSTAGNSAGNAGGNSTGSTAANSAGTTAGNASQNPASNLGQTAAEGASVVGQLDATLVEQLAMMQPEKLEDVKVKSSNGEKLGEIEHVARSRNNDQMVAVVSLEEGSDMTAIPLDYLQIHEISYDGDEDDLEDESYDGSEFQLLGAR